MQKKVIVLGVIVLALILLFVLFVFMGKKNPNVKSGTPGAQIPQKNQTGSPPQGSAIPQGNLSQYASSYFSFSYSPTLNIVEGIASVEGYTVFVNTPDSFSPNVTIEIQVNPENKVSVSHIKEVLAAFQLKSSSTTVGSNNIPASVYVDVSGKRQQKVTLVEYNGYVYRIDMSYGSQNSNPEIEAYYQQIISSFKPR